MSKILTKRIKMWFSKKSSSFASRVYKFWSEFGKNYDAIKQNLEDKNFEAASKIAEEALNLCLVDPTFMIGAFDDTGFFGLNL